MWSFVREGHREGERSVQYWEEGKINSEFKLETAVIL